MIGCFCIGCSSDEEFVCPELNIDASACDPATATFSLGSTNTYYPLVTGLRTVLEGQEDGVSMRVERTVLTETQVVDGVETHILEHKTFQDDMIHEIARNFYVEASDGTVCYFGEDVEFYEGGTLLNTEGTWRAGVDGAKPGIIMPASPAVGDSYPQEVAPGSAEDQAEVTQVGESTTVGAGTFDNVVTIVDRNPIDDEDPCEPETKRYAPGIGEVQDVTLVYVSHESP